MIAIKNAEQIEGIRRSCRLAARTVQEVGRFVQPGVTTDFLDGVAAEFIRSNGGTSASLNYAVPRIPTPFPKNTCISVNEEVCHGIPGKRELKEGDVVKIDVATVLDGFYGDTCWTFVAGKPTKKMAGLVLCGQECLDIGVRQVRPGAHIGDIGFHISNYAHAHGYSVVHQFAGHGVGLAFHEEPSVPHIGKRGEGAEMKPGMIFTIEPMINFGVADLYIDHTDHWTARTMDGKVSVQNEHTVLVSQDGVEVLTQL
jgi:methionyl aminopeptidase